MTIREVIAQAKAYRQPGIPEADMLQVINNVELRAIREVIRPRAGETETFEPYTEEDMNSELLIPAPYDRVYVHAINSENDDRENQIGNLSNERRYYESDFANYASWYTRTHVREPRRLRADWYGI